MCSVSSLTRSARNAARWNHFEQALAFCRASGFKPELAWTCHDYAAALLDSGARDDRAKAAALLDEGEQIATALDLVLLRKRILRFANVIDCGWRAIPPV